ncbi:MAG: glycoside hydrolase family 2 TIM barrel-domain containing protein [Bacteroidaceae bacterium]|nr:glycoside hydrolase family 2 TIM barrel-domain containing protein [Bacteroidaceae bacterium]
MAINRNILKWIQFFCMAATTIAVQAQRQETVLREGWKFSRAEGLDTYTPAQNSYNDNKWQTVQVPHDWAISGPFNKDIDKQVVAIEQNGEKEATEKTGRSGSLPWVGQGWYRTTFTVGKDYSRAILNFDGAMSEPEVYVNGKKAGEWKYGYTPFLVDVTPYIHKDGSANTLAVRLQNVEESSRWYPGAGLFRPVTLITTGDCHLSEWSINVETKRLNKVEKAATMKLSASLNGNFGNNIIRFSTNNRMIDVYPTSTDILGEAYATTELTIDDVTYWSPESPKLYELTVSIIADGGKGKVLDSKTVKYGIRTIEVHEEGGFMLNDVSRKFKGVCLHHDLGMIGTAVNKAALIRQIELLKSMGCDAIRTAHNMPSQMQMDVCDSLGMMVMAESFDMWVYPKCKNGYARFYKDWWKRDIQNLIYAHRLHPSIVMWSIGNEIPEQGSKDGNRMTREMQNFIRKIDQTRPITAGMDRIDNAIATGYAQVLDVPGINYRTHRYHAAYEKLRHGFILGSETASTVSSRGVYKFPVQRFDGKAYDDGQCSSYDMEACWWSNVPEEDWLLQEDEQWVIGEFVWTGFDYLGEPTPYDEYWPSRSSYFGIFDLAGLPKDRYYLYRSHWNKEEETIHLLPHWTFPGREGEVTPVYCYTSYPTAELFVNGKSQGKITKRTDVKRGGGKDGRITDVSDPAIDRYRLRWNKVKYEPGELKVVVFDDEGKEAGYKSVKTAGAASAILLTGDLGTSIKDLKADGEDMTFITVNILDKEGNLVPDADQQITVSVTGAATFKGICNGDATSTEVFTKPTMKVFHGQLVIGIQSNGKTGKATVKVHGKGLKPATTTVNAL